MKTNFKPVLFVGVIALIAGVFALPYIGNTLEFGSGMFAAATLQSESKVKQVDDSNFESTLKDSKTIILVDFYADWCGPCRKIKQNVEEIAKEFDGQVLVVKVDVDTASRTASSQGIRSIPTLKIYKPGSTDVSSTKVGYQDLEALRKWVKEELAK